MMKKLITLLLAVSLMVTLTPAMSFADESDGQQDAGQVIQMESQEEAGEALMLQAQEEADQTVGAEPQTVVPENVEPQGGADADPEADIANGEVEDGLGTAGDLPSITWESVNGRWKCKIGNVYIVGKMQQIGAAFYLFDAAGFMMTGLQTFENGTFYFNPNGINPASDGLGAELNGWINLPGRGMCYFDPAYNGAMAIGSRWIGGYNYFFAANGAMQANCFQRIGASLYYFGSNGAMRTGWLSLGNDRYYLGTDGAVKTGWQNVSGDRYYFNPSDGKMFKGGPVQIGKSKYYFNPSSGKMAKGWEKIGGSRYYFNSNGAMQTGWFTYKNNKYYLQSNGAATVGLKKIKGYNYFFQSDGSMLRNRAVKVKGKLYYFPSSGKGRKKKGWFKGSDGAKRYSLGKGRVQTGKKKIKGKWYIFNSDTGVAKTIGDSFDNKVQTQTSKTSYLIAINRAKYEVRVYQGKKNNWTRIKKMSCGIGAPATPTPAGTFVTTSRMQVNAYTLNGTKVRYWYHTQFQSDGNKGIHSGLYYVDTGQPYDVNTKTQNSQGSVRVDLGNAEWIYYNVPLYTTVYIK